MASPEIGRQLRALRLVNDGLRRVGVWLLYELLVPAAQEQLAAVGGQAALPPGTERSILRQPGLDRRTP